MNNTTYEVEYDGYNYIVVKDQCALMAFATCDEAFEAKRDCERKSLPEHWDKIPPAIRMSKAKLYALSHF